MQQSEERVSWHTFAKTAHEVPAALAALAKAVEEASLDRELVELVMLRASQINGCAFCLGFHLNAARKIGVAQRKLDLLATWHETPDFSDTERAALAYAEALTLPADHERIDRTWNAMREQFSEEEAIWLTSAIGLINAWNRIGIALRFKPPG